MRNTAQFKDQFFSAKGTKGELKLQVHDLINVTLEGKEITVSPKQKTGDYKALWGLTRSLVNNVVEGVTTGFTKELELIGVGYKANVQGAKLVLNLGLVIQLSLKFRKR